MVPVTLMIGLTVITIWWLFTWIDRKESQRRTRHRKRWSKRIADDPEADNPLDL